MLLSSQTNAQYLLEMNFVKNNSPRFLLVALCAAALFTPAIRAEDAKSTEPLILSLPLHTLKGTPEDLPAGPNIEPASDTAPPPLQVAKGVKNVAVGKPVTSSVAPFLGELKQITDGKKEAYDDDAVEFKRVCSGCRWISVNPSPSRPSPCGMTTVTFRLCATLFCRCRMILNSSPA